MGRLAVLAVAALITTNVLADVTPPTPAETLQKARRGKTEYIEVLGQLQALAPKFQTGAQCYGYIGILDQLQEIGKGYNLEAIGASPLVDFARILTSNASKFVRLAADEETPLKAFYKWADDDTRAKTGENQRFLLLPVNDKAALMTWAERIGTIIDYLRTIEAKPFVVQAHDELQALTIKKLLALKGQLTAAEMTRVLSLTKSATALGEALTFLQEQAISSGDVSYLKQIIVWALALGKNVQALKQEVPFSVKSMPGRVLVDAVSKLLMLEDAPDVSLSKEIVANLLPSQVTDLGSFLLQQYAEKLIPDGVVGFNLQLTAALIDRYTAMGLTDKARDLAKIHQRFAMLAALQSGNFEGSYSAETGEYKTIDNVRKFDKKANATVTIANIGSSNFVIGLQIERPGRSTDTPIGTDFSLFHCTYNFKDDTYEAHHFAVDSPDYIPPTLRNYYMKFKVTKKQDGKFALTGRFSSGRGFHDFVAEQYEKYPAYEKVPAGQKLDNITGVYEGTFQGRDIEVNLTQVGQRVSGTFVLPGRIAFVPLTFGYFNAPRNVVYVTSGELESGKWIQIRGQMANDGKTFRMTYIIGGQGLKIETVDLQKVQ